MERGNTNQPTKLNHPWTPTGRGADPSFARPAWSIPSSSPRVPASASWPGPVKPPRERSVLPLRARPYVSWLRRLWSAAPVPHPTIPIPSRSRLAPATGGATARATATALSSPAPGCGEPRGFVPGRALLAVSLPTLKMDALPESGACACMRNLIWAAIPTSSPR
jgi:hypothetical protein